MSKRYFDSGVAAAEGLVKGLEAQAANLDKAAIRLANELVKAVKKALGIKSPSRVFAGIGDATVKGLGIGLDETYVKRQGAQVASALEQGFGTPALDAYARAGSGGGSTVRVVLTAEQVSQVERGRALIIDIDEARSQGVRARTF
jgi:hypothetical protein